LAREAAPAQGNIQVTQADLSRLESIRALRRAWQGPLHVLVNNAAGCPPRRQETPEGIEFQWACNVLGYFWMMREFADVLRASAAPGAAARVVNVASHYAGGLDLEDPEFKRRRYDNNAAYRQSKQADRMLAAHFAELWKDAGIKVMACHPGVVDSKLSNDLGFGGPESPDQGADTPVWLASAAESEIRTGLFYARRRAEEDGFVRDRAAVERLAEICAGYG
jgi:NAD(P)-dependent dehydrogenase (short-subunit alcohol dehydrogenase family)